MNLQIPTLAFLLVVFLVAPAGNADENQGASTKLNCNIGPINRTFGRSDWIVYSCNDENSFVVVSAEGDPAMPFYFISSIKNGSRNLHGEGTGDRASSSAAYDELIKFISSEVDVQGLLLETRTVKTP